MLRHHLTGLSLGLLLTACADGVRSPTAPLATPAATPDFYIYQESVPFNPVIGLDTTFLAEWTGVPEAPCGGEGHNWDIEWRAVSLHEDGQPVGTRSNERPLARSLYVSSFDRQWIPENEPFVAFRPHRNTREAINVEGYVTNWVCSLSRVFYGQQWFYTDNGSRKTDMYEFSSTDVREFGIALRWTPADYPIDRVAADPAVLSVYAGDTARVYQRAFAPNGIQIYNQPGTAWTNTGSAGLNMVDHGMQPSQFGPAWSNSFATVTGVLAGTNTLSAAINGMPLSATVKVLPKSVISGPPNALVEGQSGTFQVATTGCNTTCTYQWSMVWIDEATGATRTRTMGTGTSQVVRAPFDTHSFELEVLTTSNGVVGYAMKPVMVIESSGCTSRTGC